MRNLLILLLASTLILAAPRGKPDAGKKAKKVEASTEMTGCLDEEQGANYVLRDDHFLNKLAGLEPTEGFPNEGFAKYVGHKVVVSGKVTAQGDQKTIKVRQIRSISDMCVPPGEQKP